MVTEWNKHGKRGLVLNRPHTISGATWMSDSSQRKEIDAFFNFFAKFDLTRPVTNVADLCDGAALFEILSEVYVNLSSSRAQTHSTAVYTEMQTTFVNQHVLLRSPLIIGSLDLARSNDCIVL
jgi:hypothetical protein